MRIGVDLGGTKIEVAALGADGRLIARRRTGTPRSYDACIGEIVALVQGVEAATKRSGTIGVGIPGVIVPETGRVKNANSTWLNGQPLGRDLSRALRRDVRVMNDANCFAISEAADGAGAGADVVFGVIIGTGVGGGIVVRGTPLEGVNLVAGEWGHNPLPWMRAAEYPGPACYCGRPGCIEMFLSGPAMARDYLRATDENVLPPEIVRHAAGGNAAAVAALERYHDRLARALSTVINVLDPDVVVLGGGMSNLPDLAAATSALLPRYVFSDSVKTRVVRNMHGDSSGVRGAAWLWPEPPGSNPSGDSTI